MEGQVVTASKHELPPMHFQHAREIWTDFPELVAGVLAAEGIRPDAGVGSRLAPFTHIAASRLAGSSEGELPEIRAWRRVFSRMGLKPTQYRCASEALLRRFKREGTLPQVHPLIDLCNAVSLAFAIPVAVFDVAGIAQSLEVRYAAGDESYLTFTGEVEHPAVREVVFVDAVRRVHARRWTNRQSGYSAVREATIAVLIVAEAVHESASADIRNLVETIAGEVVSVWSVSPKTAILSESSPRFEW
jgi:DNA/RNA-binding domain of Phe-tRNA-synthetase-like protein